MNVEDTYPHSSLLVSPSDDNFYCVISERQAHIQNQGLKQLNTFATLTQPGNKSETFNECFPSFLLFLPSQTTSFNKA